MFNYIVTRVFCLELIMFGASWTQTTLFDTIPDCEPFIDTHRLVMEDLNDHIVKEEKNLEGLKRELNEFQREYVNAKESLSNYLASPMNIFMLIKRLTAEIDASSTMGFWRFLSISTKYKKSNGTKIPTMQDLTRAAHALSRLRAIYKLNIEKMADGLLDDAVAYSSPMTAGDCYTLSRLLYISQDYYGALEWMKQAQRKYHDRDDVNDKYIFQKYDMEMHIKSAESFVDFLERMVSRTNDVLKMRSTNAIEVVRNLPHCGGNLDVERFFQLNHHNPDKEVKEEFKQAHARWRDWELYTSLCRGERTISYRVKHRLTCYYLTENHPFLWLARIRTEQLHVEPNVFMFYDVISDDEIDRIKNLAKLKFNSKKAELEAEEVAVISRRVSDLSGLGADRPLQVLRYDVGEYFEEWYCNAAKMSEVHQGGATVFPRLGLTVFPKKNAALFWTNTNENGCHDSIFKTACPVLRGTMWSKQLMP